MLRYRWLHASLVTLSIVSGAYFALLSLCVRLALGGDVEGTDIASITGRVVFGLLCGRALYRSHQAAASSFAVNSFKKSCGDSRSWSAVLF